MKHVLGLILTFIVAFGTGASHGQVRAQARLSDSPPDPVSLATGFAKVELDGTKLNTEIYFGPLDSGNKGTYIYCCEATVAESQRATAALAGVQLDATDVRTANQHDLTKAEFWDSGFVGGGTIDQARIKLAAGLAAGKAHFVVATLYAPAPDGEIQGKFESVTAFAFTLRAPRNLLAAAEAGNNHYTCSKVSERCVIPIYVSSGASGGDLAECNARIDFDLISVPIVQGRKIRVIWQLVEGTIGDTNIYRFRGAGVELFKNNPTKNFNARGTEGTEVRRYKWVQAGADTTKLDYHVYVERVNPNTGATMTCGSKDPRIGNTS